MLEVHGCPTWYQNTTTGHCKCGSDLNGRLICKKWNQSVEISAGFCITYDVQKRYDRSAQVVGSCTYGYFSGDIMTKRKYSVVNPNLTDVNRSQCEPYKRRGLFCSQCEEGFGPAVYSFNLHCANCSEISTAAAISLYCFLEFTPIAVFFFVVLFFRLNIMSGPKLGYIIFCQAVINTLQYSRYVYLSLFSNLSKTFAVIGHAGLVIAGIWNLEFFRFIIPPFCISERMTDLHVQMLGFLTSLFPLSLVVLTYSVIEINARYSIIKRWNVFTNRNVEHSIIHAFATFTILSISSTACQGYAILQSTSMFNITGKVIRSILTCNPEIVMFSQKHFPYLFVSLVLVFILVMCPGLLIVIYPTRVYGKLSSCLSARKQLMITIFAETIHGDFKNGLNGTRDYRAIPGVFILLALAFSLLMSILPHFGFDGFPPLTIGFILACTSLLVSYLRPCKSLPTNMSLSFNLLLIGALSILTALWWQDLVLDTDVLAMVIVVGSVIPHVLILAWIGHCVLYKFNLYSRGAEAVLNVFRSTCGRCQHKDDSQLHAIVTSDEQQPLL